MFQNINIFPSLAFSQGRQKILRIHPKMASILHWFYIDFDENMLQSINLFFNFHFLAAPPNKNAGLAQGEGGTLNYPIGFLLPCQNRSGPRLEPNETNKDLICFWGAPV